jgi:hypothetical protein
VYRWEPAVYDFVDLCPLYRTPPVCVASSRLRKGNYLYSQARNKLEEQQPGKITEQAADYVYEMSPLRRRWFLVDCLN